MDDLKPCIEKEEYEKSMLIEHSGFVHYIVPGYQTLQSFSPSSEDMSTHMKMDVFFSVLYIKQMTVQI